MTRRSCRPSRIPWPGIDLDIAALSVHGNAVHPDKAVAEKAHTEFENAVLLAEKLGVETRGYLLRLPRRLPRGQDSQLGDLPLAGRLSPTFWNISGTKC